MSSLVDVSETFGLTEDQSMSGTSPLTRRKYSPRRLQAIHEAAQMWKRCFDGDLRASVQVREALSTSDLFVSATGDVLDRELMARYADITPEWQNFAMRTTVRNFKPKKLVDLLGGKSALSLVPELTEYPMAGYSTAEFNIQVQKYGRRFGFSWEAQINDDLDELQQIPGRFASAAALTEDVAALSQLVTVSTGAPNTNFFKAANNNAPSALPLTEANLTTALTTVNSAKTDAEGNLLTPEAGLILVVGPANELNARRLLATAEVRVVDNNRTTTLMNPLAGMVRLVVLRRLKGNAWFILPDPNAPRPAFAVAFLRGWETPDIRQKNQAGTTGGGGAINPDAGDFEDDSIYYRVRHVVGAASVDPTHTYASTG